MVEAHLSTATDWVAGYVCPACRGELQFDEEIYSCVGCAARWPAKGKIARFSDNEVPYSVFDPQTASVITELAETDGWSKAIERHAGSIGAYSRGYICDESRADWQVLLPIGPTATVLDIGSGWGNIAVSMARRCGHVFCGDVNLTNLRLLSCRVIEEGLRNVDQFLYDPNRFLRLPFASDSIDIVVLNGVLEWMGNVEISASPQEIQVEALREIFRVLRPSGVLYVGIENRYSLSALGGARLHGELPFVGLLPRWLSNAITQLVRGEPHRTYIYSMNGYRRLLRRAGFQVVDFHWPYPSYHNPNYLIPLAPRWVKRFWLDSVMVSRSKKFRTARALGLGWLPFHSLAFSYSIRCWK